MRKIRMFNRVTADGCFASAEGSLDWAIPEPEFDRKVSSNLGATGAILFGRRTYQMFESFWPHVVEDNPRSPDPHGGPPSPEMRAMGEWINNAEKYVFSRSLREVTWKNSHLLGEFDHVRVEALKHEEGGDMMIFGSASIVTLLTEHRLIDEYQFIVTPLFLGGGRHLLDGLTSRVSLDLLDATKFSSGNLMLRYETKS